MNTISKTHQRFSVLLNNPRILSHPEEFLGLNYKEVLNFWMILEELTEDQLRVVNERYWAFYYENRLKLDKAIHLAIVTSEEVVGWNYANEAGCAAYDVTNSCAAYDVTNSYAAADWATRELIAMHLILEQQPLTFFEMFFEAL